jgi:thiol:disulfide interchange protein/DsbC/DsbD-like thiol-disulfide interchange protein
VKLLCGLALSLLMSASVNAKDFSSWRKYSQAELVAETTGFTPGGTATVGLKIHLEKNWHTYWLNPGDSGTAIHLSFKPSQGVKVEKVLFPIPEREQSGPLISFGYTREVLIPIELSLAKSLAVGRPVSLDVNIEWLVCEDVCIPAFDALHIDVPVLHLEDVAPGPDFDSFKKTRALVPQIAPEYPHFEFEGDEAKLKISGPRAQDKFIDFFPFKNSGVNNVRPQLVGDVLQFEKSNVSVAGPDRVGVLVVRSHESGKLQAYQFGDSGWKFDAKKSAENESLWWMLLSAFIGGLILNLMPCVFPILSIKLLSLMKLAKAHPREVRQQNLACVAGVLISFLSIALLLSLLRSAGNLVGWGFQLQSPVFLVLLCWLFFALSLNLLGLYEIDLLDAGFGHRLTKHGGIWGSFFTGVLAVIVASPCTAPFMGVALGFGLAQPAYVLLGIFFLLGLGLAFPYLLFVIFPSWVNVMPRPGAWMKTLKQVMAVPLMLTTVWLVWILGQVRGMNGVAIVLVGCVALGFALFLKRGVVRAFAVIILFLGIGLIYSAQSVSVQPENANGLWEPYSDARLTELKGKNVFVNMTADWCLTCKVNERLVFDNVEVQSILKAKHVIWLKGDWTQRNEEITRFLNRYDRVGVPFYVLYSLSNPAGTTLPEVLTKAAFIEFINKEFP